MSGVTLTVNWPEYSLGQDPSFAVQNIQAQARLKTRRFSCPPSAPSYNRKDLGCGEQT